MKQGTRRLALVVASALLGAGGLVVAACSTDNGQQSLPTPDSGKKDTGTGSSSGDPTEGGTPDGGGPSDAAPDCSGLFLPRVRDNSGGFFCPFTPRADAGSEAGVPGDGPCTQDETCCNSGRKDQNNFGPSFCATGKGAAACTGDGTFGGEFNPDGGSVWECADSTNCAAGQVCCMTTQPGSTQQVNIGLTNDSAEKKACGALEAYRFGGTVCRASCQAGSEIKLCGTKDQNCAAGTTCTPFAVLSRDMGYCR